MTASMLFDPTLQALQRGLNARKDRQATLAANVANVDTPGYKARALNFEAALQRSIGASTSANLNTTHVQHIPAPGAGPEPHFETTVSDAAGRTDGNNVDLEQEMATLAANGTEYRALSLLTRKKLALTRYVLGSS